MEVLASKQKQMAFASSQHQVNSMLSKCYPGAELEFLSLHCKSLRGRKSVMTAILAFWTKDVGNRNVAKNCKRILRGD